MYTISLTRTDNCRGVTITFITDNVMKFFCPRARQLDSIKHNPTQVMMLNHSRSRQQDFLFNSLQQYIELRVRLGQNSETVYVAPSQFSSNIYKWKFRKVANQGKPRKTFGNVEEVLTI